MTLSRTISFSAAVLARAATSGDIAATFNSNDVPRTFSSWNTCRPLPRSPDAAAKPNVATNTVIVTNQSDFMGTILPLRAFGSAASARTEIHTNFLFRQLTVAVLIQLFEGRWSRSELSGGDLAVGIRVERRQDRVHAHEAHARTTTARVATFTRTASGRSRGRLGRLTN